MVTARSLNRLRKRAGGFLIQSTLESLSQVAKLHPSAMRMLRDVEVTKDVRYVSSERREHQLDVYRPKHASGTLPALLYLHGGAFRILSKDTHWLMAGPYARQGYAVFNASYRLAPRFKYPAALEDAADAYAWVVDNAHRYGADASRLIIVGESAGANLSLAMTLAACFRRPEPFSQKVFATGVAPVCTLPMCGILQVSDAERFVRRKPRMQRLVADRLGETQLGYLGGVIAETMAGGLELADPLCLIESAAEPERPLPPMFAAVGTRDPLLDDTRRLAAALQRRGVHHEVVYYPGEIHAFYAMTWRKASRDCWRRQFEFLRANVGAQRAAAASGRV
ncbi:MAG: alpha/beta hydrolase [Deltaproteobacteria bacterium]|nr:alpha/beta hydrolase [Deltaproteobacteria bacterium]